MSKKSFKIGSQVHRRLSRPDSSGLWLCECSCDGMVAATGSASGVANAWRAHLAELAHGAGLDFEEVPLAGQEVIGCLATCDACGWEGSRRSPRWAVLKGHVGNCPECGSPLKVVPDAE